MKSTKKAFLLSMVSMLLCVAMLMGTTFAWFTDTVTSGTNKIVAGNLDIALYHASKNVSKTEVTESTDNLFKDVSLWEPGAYAYETFTVANEGTLALKFKMALNVLAFTSYNGHNLTEVIKVATADTAPTTREDVEALSYTALKDWSLSAYSTDNALAPNAEKTFTVVLYWEPTNNDNDFNMNNGRPQPLSIDLGITLVATQQTAESDSFDDQYDKDTTNTLPEPTKYEAKLAEAKSAKTTVNGTGTTEIKAKATPTTNTAEERQDTTVTFPQGSLTADKDAVLAVKTTNTLFAVTSAGAQVASIDLGLTVDGQPVTSFNGETVTVETYISAGLTNVGVAYNGTGDQPTLVSYDPTTGKLVFTTNHFSEYTVRGEAIAYILGDKDTGFEGYAEAAEAAKTADVELTVDANMQKAAEAAEEAGAAFVIPTQVVQSIEKTAESEEKVQENFVARIGTKYYASLKAAIAAAPENSYNGEATTIVLMRDTNGGYDIDKGRNIVLDLGGKVLTLGPAVGSHTTETNGMRVLYGNKLTVKNGTVKCSDILNDQGKKVKIGLANYDTAVLEDVNFQSGVYVIATINNAGNLTLKGNTTVAEYQNTDPTDNPDYPRGAILNSAYWYAPAGTNCSLNVNDSKVKVGTVEIAEDGNYGDTDSSNWTGKSIINISAGTFNAIVADGTQGLAEYNVTGGTFASEPDAKFIAKGYEANELDGAWIVAEIPPVEIADAGALIATFKNATDGTTMKLTNDIVMTEGYTFQKTVGEEYTLDLNGHKLDHSGYRFVVANCTFNIKDSVGTGSIVSTTSPAVELSAHHIDHLSSCPILNIYGGTLTGKNNGGAAPTAFAHSFALMGGGETDDGSINAKIINIYGGKIEGIDAGNTQLNIYGGEITSYIYAVSRDTTSPPLDGDIADTYYIYGGTFSLTGKAFMEQKQDSFDVVSMGKNRLVIKGGTFNINPSEYVPDGYTVTANGSVWTVTTNAN